MRIIDHVSLAATLAVLFLIAFVVACRAGQTETAPDGVNTITTLTDDQGVRQQSMTTVYVPADYEEGENSQTMITPELNAAARQMFGPQADALLHAVRLTMQKYDRDMESQSGRRGWHGKLVREEIFTNGLYKVETYSNETTGAIWRYRLPFKPVRSKSTGTLTFTTNGIPARLAAARARRAAQLSAGAEVTNIVHEVDVAR